ncbi:MAG: permease [Phycisphaerae bacterium]
MTRREWTRLVAMIAVLAAAGVLRVWGGEYLQHAAGEGLGLLGHYLRRYLLTALLPALILAGAIATLVSRSAVVSYLGPAARKGVAYAVASVSGGVLAVCSCTVLPLFAGIRRMGAGLGPACTFLYAGPAINVLAIVLTASVLGWKLGLARAIGAIGFALVVGPMMAWLYRRHEAAPAAMTAMPDQPSPRPWYRTVVILALMLVAVVLANWSRAGDIRAVFLCCPEGLTTFKAEVVEHNPARGTYTIRDAAGLREVPAERFVRNIDRPDAGDRIAAALHSVRWLITAAIVALLVWLVWRWVPRGEVHAWGGSVWEFAKLIVPLFLVGVVVAGALFGRSGREGLIPSRWVGMLVGADPRPLLAEMGFSGGAEAAVRAVWPIWTNLFAAVVGALMYFATLTEVPIIQGLRGAGMGDGPALSLLLAGPALSLPNMLVIRSVLGTGRTLVYVGLVVAMSSLGGLAYGALVA